MYSYATGVAEDIAPVWKDLLTSYNGNTITYDAVGNPLNWGTDISNMQWKNGRRLTSLQKWTNMISYSYDETGFRTRKSMTGTQVGLIVTRQEIWCMRHGTTEGAPDPTIMSRVYVQQAEVESIQHSCCTIFQVK